MCGLVQQKSMWDVQFSNGNAVGVIYFNQLLNMHHGTAKNTCLLKWSEESAVNIDVGGVNG